jgi:hypothetical protein
LLLLVGCSPAPSPAPDSQEGGPTWYGSVEPIVTGRCATCHAADGLGPFPLTTLDQVRAEGQAVAAAVADRSMPPWPPDPACNAYQADRSLTEAQVDTVLAWLEAGAPEGEASAPGDPLDALPGLSRVDLTLEVASPYTPVERPDEYRCFLIEWPETETTYVTGFRTSPSVPSIVHHATAYHVPAELAEDYRAMDEEDPDEGYTCWNGPGNDQVTDASWLAGWAPGTTGADFPEGTGMAMEPGSMLALQIHYSTEFEAAEPEQTTVEVKLDDAVDAEARIFRLWDPAWLQEGGMEIPAGSPDTTWSYATEITEPLTIWSASLHMHTLGIATDMTLGDTCLLDIPDWDFHWQGNYFLESPVEAANGDELFMSCTWDNSAGAEDVHWGPTTADEMCTAKLYVVDY